MALVLYFTLLSAFGNFQAVTLQLLPPICIALLVYKVRVGCALGRSEFGDGAVFC